MEKQINYSANCTRIVRTDKNVGHTEYPEPLNVEKKKQTRTNGLFIVFAAAFVIAILFICFNAISQTI